MGLPALNSPLTNLATVASPRVFARSGTAWIDGGSALGGEVRALAAALVAYGLAPGACAAVLGSEGCVTLHAELAVLAAGGALLSVDPSLTDDAFARALASFGAVQAIACDERQLARVLALRPDLPALDLVLLMSAAPSERKPAAFLAGAAMEVGADALRAEPSLLRDSLAASEDSAVLSVVDANGKAHSLGRGALTALSQRIAKTVGVEAGKAVLTALPRGGVARVATALAVAGHGATLLLADPAGTPDSGVVEHPADAAILSVTSLEALGRSWRAELDGRSWLARRMAGWSLRHGADTGHTGWKHRLADSLTLRGLRARLGGRLTRLDVIIENASTPVDPAIQSFFEAIGLPVNYLVTGGAADLGPVIAVP